MYINVDNEITDLFCWHGLDEKVKWFIWMPKIASWLANGFVRRSQGSPKWKPVLSKCTHKTNLSLSKTRAYVLL